MAATIKIKRSAVSGKAPALGDLALGELGLNTFDGKLYTRKDNGTASIVELSGGGGEGGAAAPSIVLELPTVINESLTLGASKNGLSLNNVEVTEGNSISVPENSTWTIANFDTSPITETAYIINKDVIFSANSHGISAFDVAVSSGYSVTVPSGAIWTIAVF